MAQFVDAIVKAGSPLEFLELVEGDAASYLTSLCGCTTLQSVRLADKESLEESMYQEPPLLQRYIDRFPVVYELISKNCALAALHLDRQQSLKPKGLAVRILSIQGIGGKCDQNTESVLDFFQKTPFSYATRDSQEG